VNQSILCNAKLSAHECRMALLLDQIGKRRGEVCHGARSLGERLGWSVATVRRVLRRLAALGMIESVRDYALRTRRRIRLLWSTTTSATSATSATSTFPAAALTPAVESAPTPQPEPEPEKEPEPEPGQRKATKEEVAKLKADAEKAAPADPTFPNWCLYLAKKKWGLWAVSSAVAKVASIVESGGDVRNPRGLTARILQDFETEGGPPPPPPTAEAAEAKKRAWLRELAEAAGMAYP
jgi:hypothetical protein